MKNIRIILPVAVMIFAAACQKEKITNWTGEDRIRFKTDLASDTLQSYSFLGVADGITRHTMYIEVSVEGQVRNFPRTITVKQVVTGSDDAVAGTHYVPFSEAQVKDEYMIPANSATVNIPIILLRHSSLLDDEKILRIELVGNEYFQLTTDLNRQFRFITFAEKPAKPEAWDISVTSSSNTAPYFGTYGPVKHRYMIDETNMLFDNEWFSEYFRYATTTAVWMTPRDSGYVSYLRQLLQQKLDARNAAAGTGNELKESDGTIVRFL